ncbi:oxidoreductase, putative [Ichthyophthirius multifiliis]|uniref:Oxidoreductase, putative n=1 Tax=Ichthyophthirius multifiliis TaxID=5932 RepID=G0QYI8_ICHMU|nr:oxidoreductase, putative [Ichthyophthirius multifiliis]EGR29713.1 oxidoreductase, putative [Ichthyophthirius multifiliis]|eukprot:XP_004030949.1 oxidoreductase, putative [Ichthyophthirius multifiliis]
MTLYPLLSQQETITNQQHIYPPNIVNQYKLQVDLSNQNSWQYKLEDVPLLEFMETQVINSWAPFILIQQLKDSMIKTSEKKFIVNVSSPEGQFNRMYKSKIHPHTNMSKAALNMLTKTSGVDLAKNYNIFMTAVDAGWASNDMLPVNFLHQSYYNTIPIDEWDGAFRVLDPVFEGIQSEKPYFGVFLQNYKIAEW